MHPAWQDVGCYISKFSGEMKAPIASRLQSESNRYYLEVVIQEAVKDHLSHLCNKIFLQYQLCPRHMLCPG